MLVLRVGFLKIMFRILPETELLQSSRKSLTVNVRMWFVLFGSSRALLLGVSKHFLSEYYTVGHVP